MSDGAGLGARPPALRRIVETVIGEVVLRRASSKVFVLDGAGHLIAWPAGGPTSVPSNLAPFVDTYFAQPESSRAAFAELSADEGSRVVVRIMADGSPESGRYALIVEPFAVRSHPRTEATPLPPAP
jgi:hypothetical protein